MNRLFPIPLRLLMWWLLLGPACLLAQSDPYGYTWHSQVPGRPWVALALAEEGWYAVTVSDLLAAGYDLSSASPGSLRLYYRGQEQPLHLRRDALGNLAAIEFLGQPRDGAEEASMYFDPYSSQPDPTLAPHPDMSLFGDTAVYFLSWGGPGGGLRYETTLDTAYGQSLPVASLPVQVGLLPHPDSAVVSFVRGGGSSLDPFYTNNPDYGPGEGYSMRNFAPGMSRTLSLATPYPAAGVARLDLRLFGRSHTSHHPRLHLNGQTVLDSLIQPAIPQVAMYAFSLSLTDPLQSQNVLTFTSGMAAGLTDNLEISQIKLAYLRQPIMAGKKLKLHNWEMAQASYLRLTQTTGTDSIWAYDPLAQARYAGIITGDTAHLRLPGVSSPRALHLYTDAATRSPHIRPARLRPICHPDSGAQFVIIAPRALALSAEAYATYRDTNTVNPYASRVVYSEDIYDAFGYGSYGPQAIRRFVNCALDSWNTPPAFVLLWGKGGYQPRTDPWTLMPTWGYPANDYALVSPLTTDSSRLRPRLPIGRLSITDDTEGLAYLDKVDAFEHGGWGPWRQRGLFLGGGATVGEQQAVSQTLLNLIDQFVQPPLQGQATYFQKGNPALEPDSIGLVTILDSGQAVVVFLGQSTSNLTDVPLPLPSQLQNDTRTPLVFTFGDYSGDFSIPSTQTLSERWISTSGGGAIAYLGATAWAYLSPMQAYSEGLFREMLQNQPGSRLGVAIRGHIHQYLDSLSGIQYQNHARLFHLHGDPALVIFPIPAHPQAVPVWPGDTDNDSLVTVADLLPIGLAYGYHGPPRAGVSIAWAPQYGPPWAGSFPDGTGYQHADADGNGWVEAADTLALAQNYGLGSGPGPASSGLPGGLPLSLVPPDSASAGDTVTLRLWAGHAQQMDSLYGVALTLQLDTSQYVPSSLRWNLDGSWLGTLGADLLAFGRYDSLAGQVHLALTRTDHQAVFGSGALADISIVISDDLARRPQAALPLRYEIPFALARRASGTAVGLGGLSTGLDTPGPPLRVLAGPNPVRDFLHLETDTPLDQVRVFAAQGQLMYEATNVPAGQHRLDLRALPAGLYLLHLQAGNRVLHLRLLRP